MSVASNHQKRSQAGEAKASSLDWCGAARAMVLALWAFFFAWLYLSGEMPRYLGPRTYWVVPFGALVLGGAAVAHFLALRSSSPRRLSRGELAALGMMLAPIVAITIVPSPELGALAASRKASGGLAGALLGAPDSATRPSFLQISYAEESESYASSAGIVEGMQVRLLGFVTHETGGPEGTFELARFYVSCCAADAIPYAVAVDPAGSAAELKDDTWLQVTGTLERRDSRFVVVAERLERVEEPSEPYLY